MTALLDPAYPAYPDLTAHLDKCFRKAIRITHPAHPLYGLSARVQKVLHKNNERFYGILLPDGTSVLIPSAWTDASSEENSVYQRAGALFRVQDLLRLRKLVDSLESE
ncbi:DUF5372 family protein [Candidatus Poribacteria bacterium]